MVFKILMFSKDFIAFEYENEFIYKKITTIIGVNYY